MHFSLSKPWTKGVSALSCIRKHGIKFLCVWGTLEDVHVLVGPALGGRTKATLRDVKFGLTPKLLLGPTPGSSEKWDLQVLRVRMGKNSKHESCSLGCFLGGPWTDFKNKAPMAFVFKKNRELVRVTKFQRFTCVQIKTGINWARIRKYSKHKSFRSFC